MIEWLTTLWLEGQWYDKTYIILFFVWLLFGIIFLLFLRPYQDVSDQLEREYNALAAGHFFISFRKGKQAELRQRATYKVSSRNQHYTLYQIASNALSLSTLGFGLGLTLLIGSFVYEKIHFPSTEDEEVYTEEIDYYDEGYDYEDPYENEGPGTHHVDPHWVDGYTRDDGTEVEGYWRGGEDGYERSNPDGDLSNNLDSYDYNESDDGYDGIGAEIGEFLFE